jgi:hypothetical protein
MCILIVRICRYSAHTGGLHHVTAGEALSPEIEYHRRLRTVAPGIIDARSLHTSYALQTGYEQLILATGTVTPHHIETLRERFILAGDARDLLAARDSLKQLLGIRLLDG